MKKLLLISFCFLLISCGASKKEKSELKTLEQNFLDENKKREGVKTTDSGLQYEVLKEGKGANPKLTDLIEIYREIFLINGEKVNEHRFKLPLNEFQEKTWREALQLMKEGAKYKFYVTPELRRRESPEFSSDILRNSILIFEIEIIEIN